MTYDFADLVAGTLAMVDWIVVAGCLVFILGRFRG
jgi:hypothetical protein